MKKIFNFLILSILFFCIQSTAWSANFSLKRTTIIAIEQGITLDSLRGDMSVTGTMTVDGSLVKQNIVTCTGTGDAQKCATVDVESQILSVGVNNSTVSLAQPDGSVSEIILLSLNPIITMLNGGSFVEVDQWELTDTLSNTSNQAIENNEKQTSGKFGFTVFDALNSLGLVPFP